MCSGVYSVKQEQIDQAALAVNTSLLLFKALNGDEPRIRGVLVRWYGGEEEFFRDVEPNSVARLREGAKA